MRQSNVLFTSDQAPLQPHSSKLKKNPELKPNFSFFSVAAFSLVASPLPQRLNSGPSPLKKIPEQNLTLHWNFPIWEAEIGHLTDFIRSILILL